MKTIEQILVDLGLNEKEVAIYLQLLEAGTSTASAIAHHTGFLRSTTHYTCQQLGRKGLISGILRNNVYLFTAAPPEKLSQLLERRKREVERDEERLQSVIGRLKDKMTGGSVVPKVQFFEGAQGIIDLNEHILAIGERIDSFEEIGKVLSIIPEYAAGFPKKRVALGIPNRCIAPTGSPLNVSDPHYLIEVRYMDAQQYPFTWQIRICKDLVGIFSFEASTAVAISIRHSDIAYNFHLLFEYMWASLAGPVTRK